MSPQRLKELQNLAKDFVNDVFMFAADEDQGLLYLAVAEHYVKQLIDERIK